MRLKYIGIRKSSILFHQEFRWLKSICMTIMIKGFIDFRKKLKNKDYRAA